MSNKYYRIIKYYLRNPQIAALHAHKLLCLEPKQLPTVLGDASSALNHPHQKVAVPDHAAIPAAINAGKTVSGQAASGAAASRPVSEASAPWKPPPPTTPYPGPASEDRREGLHRMEKSHITEKSPNISKANPQSTPHSTPQPPPPPPPPTSTSTAPPANQSKESAEDASDRSADISSETETADDASVPAEGLHGMLPASSANDNNGSNKSCNSATALNASFQREQRLLLEKTSIRVILSYNQLTPAKRSEIQAGIWSGCVPV
jgi:hypothetical protein